MTTWAVALLTTHLFATAAMVGLIWFVQVVHYPLFARVGSPGFSTYADEHQRLTAWVVGPFMAVEGVSALLVAASLRDEVGLVLPLLGLALLLIIHASRVLLQVPAHGRLSGGFDPDVVHRLVLTNRIRTVGWSARGVVAFAMVMVAVPT